MQLRSSALLIALSLTVGVGLDIAAQPDQTNPSPGVADSPLPTYYYYYDGAPLPLQLDTTRFAVKVSSRTAIDASTALAASQLDIASAVETGVSGWILATTHARPDGSGVVNRRLEQLLESPAVEFASPVFLLPSGGWMTVTPDILIRLKADSDANAVGVLSSMGIAGDVTDENFAGMDKAFKVRSAARSGFDVLAEANRLARDPRVEWAEPDMQATVVKHLTPNDPGWSYLWGLNNTGQSGGTADIDMDCDLAWDIGIGDPAVKVLVLDDGVDLLHPDLNVAGGADFTGHGTGGGPYNQCDNHGTAVAGCISAVVNNGLGTIGAAPGCRVLAAKYTVSNVPCDGGGTFQFSWLASALGWGQQQGARVSNNSNGLPPSSTVTAKYQDTYAAGMVHFGSAGNDGAQSIGYPASLAVVNAVSAINRYGNKASFSSYGSNLSLAAPGQSIYTTDRSGSSGYSGGDYVSVNGTSFSSPYAAAVAALVVSADPWLTAPEVEEQLRTTATDLGTPGFDIYFGHGLVNAYEATNHARIDVTADVTFGPAPLLVSFTGSTTRPAIGWEWDFGDGGSSADQNPSHEYAGPGYFTVATTIQTADNSFTKTSDGLISVYADTVDIREGRFVGSVGSVTVDARNYLPLSMIEIPFSYAGPLNIRFDSVTSTDLRTAFMRAEIISLVDASKTASVVISADAEPYLQPGNGPIATLWFTLLEAGSVGTAPVEITSYPRHTLTFRSYAGDYTPASLGGSIVAGCCRGIVGDVNGDGGVEPTIADISFLIDHLFISSIPLGCYLEADANQSGGSNPTPADISISDVSILVDHLFISEAPLPNCL